jgi:predicted porin
LNYANGPINLDAVYQSRQNVTLPEVPLVPGTGKDINEWYLGGSWDFKVVKLYGSYQALDNKNDIRCYRCRRQRSLDRRRECTDRPGHLGRELRQAGD